MPQAYIHRAVSGVDVPQRSSDGYINATALSNAHEERTGERREPYEWVNSSRIKKTLQHLSRSTGIPVDRLVVLVTSGPNKYRGTYIHPRLSTRYAIWLSDDFGDLVEEWVQSWMTTGHNPVADVDRVAFRDQLKDKSRLELTDAIKEYLEQIRRYDDRRYRGKFFARSHDSINEAITTETAGRMRERLSQETGKFVKESELIRDYFPPEYLQHYVAVCRTAANFMLKDDLHPSAAIEKAIEYALPSGYAASPIDFVEHINIVRQRLKSSGSDIV